MHQIIFIQKTDLIDVYYYWASNIVVNKQLTILVYFNIILLRCELSPAVFEINQIIWSIIIISLLSKILLICSIKPNFGSNNSIRSYSCAYERLVKIHEASSFKYLIKGCKLSSVTNI